MVALCFCGLRESKGQNADTNKIFIIAQQMPQFNGSLAEYLTAHLTYPKSAAEKNVEGTVNISFVVERSGGISNIKAANSVEHSLDSAAIACVAGMPKWNPGMQNGQPVRVQYEIPVRFTKPTIGSSSVNPDGPVRVK